MLPMEIRIVHDFTSLENVLVNVLTRLAAMPAPEMLQPVAAAPAVATAPEDQKPQSRRGRPSKEEKAAAAATNVTADAAPAAPPVPAAPAQVSPSPAPAAPAVTTFDPFDAPAAAPAVDPNGPVSEDDLAAMRNIIMDQFIPKLGQAAYDAIRVKHGGPGVRITSLKRGQFDAFRNELLATLNA